MKNAKYCSAALLCAMALAMPAVQAQAAFPDRAVNIVVPFPAGGATDVVARLLGDGLSKIWKQSVVVENRTGAGGNIGGNYVAKAQADGYTLLVGSPAETVINALLYPEMQYDSQKDLTPVSKAGSAPLVLVIHPDVPVTSTKELIEYVKKSDKGVNYASSGTGGPQHLAAEEFKRVTSADINHIPYKGGSPAITDLVGGQVEMFFAGLPPAMPFIKAGKLRALAVTTEERSELVPDIPTLAESGLPGFHIENWQGVFVPAGTPPEIIDKISADIRQVLDQPETKQKLATQGISAAPSTPEEFRKFTDSEREKYKAIIEAANVSIK
ncbi:MAG: tripartite tricarboxylate transporter substrate binding protein [Pusillimonas sp.]